MNGADDARTGGGRIGNTDIDRYHVAREYLSQRADKTSGLIGLVEFGTIRAPGVSDLDVIAIVDRGVDLDTLAGFADFSNAPDAVVEVLDYGAVKYVTPDQFERLNILGAIRAKGFWGRVPVLECPDEGTASLVRVADVMDWLPERTAMLHHYWAMSDPPLTRLVNCIYSLGHSASRAVAEGAVDEQVVSAHQSAVDTLRAEWFVLDTLDRSNRLRATLQRSIEMAETLLLGTAEAFETRGLYRGTHPQRTTIFHIDTTRSLRFAGAEDWPQAPHEISGSVVDIPAIWLTHLLAQASSGGKIGNLLGGNIQPWTQPEPIAVDRKLSTVLAQRMTLCNDMAEFLVPRGMWSAMYRFAHIKPVTMVDMNGASQ